MLVRKNAPNIDCRMHELFSYNKGKGGLINSKWPMIMDYERIEKDYGSVPIRIVDHVTYMYYLAFFIVKDNPRKQGKSLSKPVLFRFFNASHLAFSYRIQLGCRKASRCWHPWLSLFSKTLCNVHLNNLPHTQMRNKSQINLSESKVPCTKGREGK